MIEQTNLLGMSTDQPISRRKAVLITAGCAAATLLGGTLAKAQSMSGMAKSMSSMVGSEDYATKTLMVGGLSLETSRIAKEKANSDTVKTFAGLEMEEQEAVSAILKANGATVPMMSKMQQDKIAELSAMSGKDFDKKYLEMQVEGHQKLLKIQQMKIEGTPTDPQVIVAKLATTSIQTHLVMLDMIKSMA